MTESNGVQRLVRSDPARDVNEFAPVRDAPVTGALDLRRVTLRRDSRSLEVDLETAAQPRGTMTQSFVVLGARAVRGVRVRIDWGGSDAPRGNVSGPGQRSRAITVKATGTSVAFRLPLDRYTRRPVFKWRAATAITGRGGDTTDTVPGTPETTSYEFFPESPG